MKPFKDTDRKERAASKDRFYRRPVSTIVYSFIGKLLHCVGCFRVRRWLSYAPRCPTSQCLGSPRVSNTPPSGTLWLTSSTEMSITCKKSKSKSRFSGDLFRAQQSGRCLCAALNYMFEVTDLITPTAHGCRCYLLPYLVRACSRSPWQHSARLGEQQHIVGWESALPAWNNWTN